MFYEPFTFLSLFLSLSLIQKGRLRRKTNNVLRRSQAGEGQLLMQNVKFKTKNIKTLKHSHTYIPL